MAETTTIEKPASPALAIGDIQDGATYTVLYNYGLPIASTTQRLGGIKGIVTFSKGVALRVLAEVVKAWLNRVDVEGKRIAYLPRIIVLPDGANEADFAIASGLISETQPAARTVATLKGIPVDQLVEMLGEQDARVLADAIYKHLGIQASTAFTGSGARKATR